ncbi:MAG: hypothetical protein H0U74_12215 [Bradymonadaceae bacterium]|nr:hypothetical protein [Lujinxingiaceae bacterium]
MRCRVCPARIWKLIAVVPLWALVSTALGCATTAQKRAEQARKDTYELVLQERVHAYVYEMGCAAVLPVAEELLFNHGYQTQHYDAASHLLEMQWKYRDEDLRSRYLVQGVALDEQRCNVQIVHQEEAGAATHASRTYSLELELLNRVHPRGAEQVRGEARLEAERVYEESLGSEGVQL